MIPPSQRSGDDPPGGNYLYLSLDPPTGRACFEAFDQVAPNDSSLVLVTRSPGESLRRWRQVHDEPPADVSIVSISDQARSVETRDPATGAPTDDGIWTVSHPGDLTGIGIALTEILSEQTNLDRRFVVCFEALGALLQYAPVKPAYRFLHQLTSQLGQAGAIAHFHVARYQFGDGPVDRIRPLFDDVIGPGTSED